MVIDRSITQFVTNTTLIGGVSIDADDDLMNLLENVFNRMTTTPVDNVPVADLVGAIGTIAPPS